MATPNNNLVDKTLSSIEGINRAETPPFLFGKIMHRIKTATPEPVYYTGAWLIRTAVTSVVIITLNALTIWVVNHQPKQQVNEQMELHKFAQEYFGNDNVASYYYQ